MKRKIASLAFQSLVFLALGFAAFWFFLVTQF